MRKGEEGTTGREILPRSKNGSHDTPKHTHDTPQSHDAPQSHGHDTPKGDDAPEGDATPKGDGTPERRRTHGDKTKRNATKNTRNAKGNHKALMFDRLPL